MIIPRLLRLFRRFTIFERLALVLIVANVVLFGLLLTLGIALGQLQSMMIVLAFITAGTLMVVFVAVLVRVRLYRRFVADRRRRALGQTVIGYAEDTRGWGSVEQSHAPDIALRSSVTRRLAPHRLVRHAARSRSHFALDVLAHVASAGRFDYLPLSDVAATYSRGVVPDPSIVVPEIDMHTLVGLIRTISGRPVDAARASALVDLAVCHASKGDSEVDLLALAEICVALDRRHDAERILTLCRKATWARQLVAADLVNPFLEVGAPDERRKTGSENLGDQDSWLALANEMYRSTGLEPITLRPNGDDLDAFDRIVEAATVPKVDGGPLVTVIMSTWSPDAATVTAIKSIIAQSWQNWELLVMDDSSPQAFDEVLKEISSLDSRVTVHRSQTNAGTYVRRNEALVIAKGEFVTMHDSDDWAHPRRLELQVRHLQQNPQIVANTVASIRMSRELRFVQPRGLTLRLSEPGLMYRREKVTAKIGYFDSVRRGADTEFRMRMEHVFEQPTQILPTGAPLMLMRFDFESLSGSDFGNGWTHPERFAYRSAHRHWRESKTNAGQVPYIGFEEARQFPAPSRLTGLPRKVDLDFLIVADARRKGAPVASLRRLSIEMSELRSAGARVGFMQVEAIAYKTAENELDPAVQELINSGKIVEVFPTDVDARIDCLVIRHASAALGIPLDVDESFKVSRAVVVIEGDGGPDRLGETYAPGTVNRALDESFRVVAQWVNAESGRVDLVRYIKPASAQERT